MLAADNDNGRSIEFRTDRETSIKLDALRTHLGLDDDAELLEVALETYEQFEPEEVTSAEIALSKAAGLSVVRRFQVTEATGRAIDAEVERTGYDEAQIVRQAMRALFQLSRDNSKEATVTALRT